MLNISILCALMRGCHYGHLLSSGTIGGLLAGDSWSAVGSIWLLKIVNIS